MESVCVGSVQEILSAGRKRCTVQDRDIIVISHNREFYALDSFCYHAGGPLHEGDIEDFGGSACLVCPWHKYKISISSGEGLYLAVDPFAPRKKPEMKSKGAKQRTHHVHVENGQVFVRLSTLDSKLDSDQYNSLEYRKKFDLK